MLVFFYTCRMQGTHMSFSLSNIYHISFSLYVMYHAFKHIMYHVLNTHSFYIPYTFLSLHTCISTITHNIFYHLPSYGVTYITFMQAYHSTIKLRHEPYMYIIYHINHNILIYSYMHACQTLIMIIAFHLTYQYFHIITHFLITCPCIKAQSFYSIRPYLSTYIIQTHFIHLYSFPYTFSYFITYYHILSYILISISLFMHVPHLQPYSILTHIHLYLTIKTHCTHTYTLTINSTFTQHTIHCMHITCYNIHTFHVTHSLFKIILACLKVTIH